MNTPSFVDNRLRLPKTQSPLCLNSLFFVAILSIHHRSPHHEHPAQ